MPVVSYLYLKTDTRLFSNRLLALKLSRNILFLATFRRSHLSYRALKFAFGIALVATLLTPVRGQQSKPAEAGAAAQTAVLDKYCVTLSQRQGSHRWAHPRACRSRQRSRRTPRPGRS
jgi:hypothetical protein